MRFEIRVYTDDEMDQYVGSGATMSEAADAFCLTMSEAPQPFSDRVHESWTKFCRAAAERRKAWDLISGEK